MSVVSLVIAGALAALVVLMLLLVPLVLLVLRRLRSGAGLPGGRRSFTRPVRAVPPGPPLLDLMPPRSLLYAVFSRYFGTRHGIEELVTSMLGGAGQELDGSDTAVGHRVTANIRLESYGPGTCKSVVRWTYEFPGMRNNHLFVIFGTHDRDVASRVVNERVFPLFELWLMQSEDEFNEFARTIRDTVQIGVTYVAGGRDVHEVEPRRHRGHPVQLNRLSEFVRVRDNDDMETLNVIAFDLHDLAHDDHHVTSIEKLTVQASNVGANKGWFAWSVPFPCYVDEVAFDVLHLTVGKGPLEFAVVVSTSGFTSTVRLHWQTVTDVVTISIGAWMLAGHGVTILWRSAETPESTNGVADRR